MSGYIDTLRSDKIIKTGTYFTSGVFVLTLAGLLLSLRNLPPILPIYNQMPWGEARLGSILELFLPFTLGLIFFISNLVFSLSVYSKMPLVARTLTVTSLLISFLTMIFTFRTIQLVY